MPALTSSVHIFWFNLLMLINFTIELSNVNSVFHKAKCIAIATLQKVLMQSWLNQYSNITLVWTICKNTFYLTTFYFHGTFFKWDARCTAGGALLVAVWRVVLGSRAVADSSSLGERRSELPPTKVPDYRRHVCSHFCSGAAQRWSRNDYKHGVASGSARPHFKLAHRPKNMDITSLDAYFPAIFGSLTSLSSTEHSVSSMTPQTNVKCTFGILSARVSIVNNAMASLTKPSGVQPAR